MWTARRARLRRRWRWRRFRASQRVSESAGELPVAGPQLSEGTLGGGVFVVTIFPQGLKPGSEQAAPGHLVGYATDTPSHTAVSTPSTKTCRWGPRVAKYGVPADPSTSLRYGRDDN